MSASATRVRILTGYNAAFLPIANLTVPRLRDYAARHGFEFDAATDMDAAPFNTIWAKVPLILKALDEGVEFVIWIDSDALIIRLEQDIRDSISEHADIQMVWHGPDTSRIDFPGFVPHYNAGIMLIRNTEWSRDFFTRVWELRFTIDHLWCDQAAILWLLGYRECIGAGADMGDVPDRAHVGRLDCAWNSIPGVVMSDDPVIHHYAGMGNAHRAKLMATDAASLAERESSAVLRRTISYQLSMWSLDVRHWENDANRLEQAALDNADMRHQQNLHAADMAHMRHVLNLHAAEVERLVRAAHALEGAPRQLMKMLPRAFYRRLSRLRDGRGYSIL